MLTIQEVQALRTRYSAAHVALTDAQQRSKQLSTVYARKNEEVQAEIAAAQAEVEAIKRELREGIV